MNNRDAGAGEGAPEPLRAPGGRRPALRTAVIVFLAFSAVGLGATLKLLVWPPSGSPRRADAVIVLSGDHGERLARAVGLMDSGVAPTLVLAGEPDFQQVRDLCLGGQPFEVVCLRPEPDSTRAEARAAARLAAERRWQTVVVVTTTGHVARAGLLFRRCLDASVSMVAARRPLGWRGLTHEWLGLGHAVIVARSC